MVAEKCRLVRRPAPPKAPLHQRWPSGRLSLLERQARPALRLDNGTVTPHRQQTIAVQQPDQAHAVEWAFTVQLSDLHLPFAFAVIPRRQGDKKGPMQ
jgi:hypothetical protein